MGEEPSAGAHGRRIPPSVAARQGAPRRARAHPPPTAPVGTPSAARARGAEDDDDGPDLGWIGLLGLAGLAGLAGLRRREPTVVHRETVHTEPRR